MRHLEHLPDLVKELIQAGVEVTLTQEGYRLYGFPKIGSVTLLPQEVRDGHDDPPFWAKDDRYKNTRSIYGLEDILDIISSWWKRKPECGPPPSPWIELMLKHGMIEEKQTKTYTFR